MCKIKNNIKFCTCKASSTKRLEHYWCLYRYNKTKDEDIHIIGEVVFPNELFTLNYEVNKVVLQQRLNEDDAFDVVVHFKPKDIFVVVCYNHDFNKRLVYGFIFKGKRWQFCDISAFEIMNHYDELVFGKMKKN